MHYNIPLVHSPSVSTPGSAAFCSVRGTLKFGSLQAPKSRLQHFLNLEDPPRWAAHARNYVRCITLRNPSHNRDSPREHYPRFI